jgi:hypothetical protein
MVSRSQAEQDPNKPASESNHHLAGYALIAIGLLVLAGQSSSRLRLLHLVWPFLFVAVGLFLAAWSDIEIWPRGNLSWTWLVRHDLEARQHKLIAILLIAIGLVEYLRPKLSRFWGIWAFPLLALVGVGVLLSHDHGGSSGASSPEARNYVVSWLAGEERKADEKPTMAPSDRPPAVHHSEMEFHHGDHGAQHTMTASMLRVERQHMWFALIGIFVIFFKVIHDSAVWRHSFVPFLWPIWIFVLGMLLVFYTE